MPVSGRRACPRIRSPPTRPRRGRSRRDAHRFGADRRLLPDAAAQALDCGIGARKVRVAQAQLVEDGARSLAADQALGDLCGIGSQRRGRGRRAGSLSRAEQLREGGQLFGLPVEQARSGEGQAVLALGVGADMKQACDGARGLLQAVQPNQSEQGVHVGTLSGHGRHLGAESASVDRRTARDGCA